MAEQAGETHAGGPDPLVGNGFSLKPILIPAFAPAMLFGVAEGAALPVVALTARDLGGSLATASFVVALIGVGSLVSNIPSALITTRYGERIAIIVAGAVAAGALVLAMLAPDNLVLGLAMLLVGFADAVFILARQSYLTEMVPAHLRARRCPRSAARPGSASSVARSWERRRSSSPAPAARSRSAPQRRPPPA